PGPGFGTAGRVPRIMTGPVPEDSAAAVPPADAPGGETMMSPLSPSAAEAGSGSESRTAPSSMAMTAAPERARNAQDCSTTRLLQNYRVSAPARLLAS